jgi:hypothetical protein
MEGSYDPAKHVGRPNLPKRRQPSKAIKQLHATYSSSWPKLKSEGKASPYAVIRALKKTKKAKTE